MGGEIRFLLGNEERTIASIRPTTTVLEYLRGTERRTGTKEGCAEGDCGACTVMLAEPDGEGGLRSWTVNSCIQFVPSLHGRQLVTVEDVGRNGLHPVQEALVERHGSQCGFCTPGFVMQLYGGWRNGELSDRARVKDWIAGNLCRCTGYGPIVEAGLDAGKAGGATAEADRGTAERLSGLDDGAMLQISSDEGRWFAPRNLDELARVYAANPDAVLVAGATDVGLWVTKQHRDLPVLIDISRVPELRRIEHRDPGIRIGAAVTHSEALGALAGIHPDLSELMRRFAGVQIRNAGTVGGNIANGSPIGDLPPALIALGARLRLRRGDTVREMPLEAFFLAYGKQDRAPGEFVESVFVPKLGPDSRFACYKLSKRFDSDISAVLGAFRLDLDGDRIVAARLAFGGMAATPKRGASAEAALSGKRYGEAAFEAAAEALSADFAPITDMRASAGYRLEAAQNMLRRFHLELAGTGAAALRILEIADG